MLTMRSECPVIWQMPTGFSSWADKINGILEKIRIHSQQPISKNWREEVNNAISKVESECNVHGWDGYNSDPVNPIYGQITRDMVNLMPDNIQAPDVVPESNGKISLDWGEGDKQMFSMTVSTGYIIYAGYFGDETKHGRVQVNEVIPQEINCILSKYFKKS